MARDRQRRSLLGNTPTPRQRYSRTPGAIRVMDDSVPTASVDRTSTPAPQMRVQTQQIQVPPDPSMVEFDLPEVEFPELSVDSFEPVDDLEEIADLEELEPIEAIEDSEEDEPVAIPTQVVPPAASSPGPVQARPMIRAPLAEDEPDDNVLAAMFRVGLTSMAVTMGVILLSWFALVSPQIEAARVRWSVPAPVVASTPVAVPTATQIATPATTPETPKLAPVALEVEVPTAPVVAVVEPVAAAEPVAVRTSQPEPAKTSPPKVVVPVKPASSRRPAVLAAVAPVRPSVPTKAEVESPRSPATAAAVVAPKVVKAPASPAPKAPAASARMRALGGKLSGSASGDSMVMQLRVVGPGRMSATIQRGSEPRRTATGSYEEQADGATFTLVEQGTGRRYSGKVDAVGASGRIRSEDGAKARFRVRR